MNPSWVRVAFLAVIISAGIWLCLQLPREVKNSEKEVRASFRLVTLDSTTIPDENDIVSHEWATHTMIVKDGVTKRIFEKLEDQLIPGCSFFVVANGERCYEGLVTHVFASGWHTLPYIHEKVSDNTPENQLVIHPALAGRNRFHFDRDNNVWVVNPETTDSRDNQQVRRSLRTLGKLK